MSEPAPIADSLKKIGIAIEAGTSPDRMDITGSPKNEEFIVKVLTVRPAENREVVRAMAELSACGEGCCGNH
ncbi:MAG: hypothetical protein K9K88_13310 [Desulfobacterales bacterium]|nr:hypothetical protein [Desulfobacterales bacterium]